MSTEEQKLIDGRLPRPPLDEMIHLFYADPPSQTTSATDAGPKSPPSESAPPYQPPQFASYQPVFAEPPVAQQSANNTVTV